jgi:hypothetical protein
VSSAHQSIVERPLPHSAESERAILGAIIVDNNLVNQAIKLLRPDDFYQRAHQLVFRAMIALSERGSEINPILLGEELRREGWPESTGGIAFISELTYGLPHFTKLNFYAKIVLEKSALRRLVHLGDELVARALEEDGDPFTTAAWAAIKLAEKIKAYGAPVHVVCMSDVEPEEVGWLWHPYVPLGKLTILEGDPGLGKSWLTCALAAAVSCGRGLPGVEPFAPSNVLMLSAEDGLGDTLRPRLDAVGADVERVFALPEPIVFDSGGLRKFEAAIQEHSSALVIIDPLFAYTGGKVDIHRANECRAISAPLAAIAERCGCALVAVRHLCKSRGGGHALNAGIGSIDFAAAARSVLLAGKDPDDETKRAVVQTKNNLAPLGPALGYKLEDGQFWWTGESDLTAGRILAAATDEEGRSTLTEAVDFLRASLSCGEREVREVQADARSAGISGATLRRAREHLHIKARRSGPVGQPQQFYWSLPANDDAQARPINAQKVVVEHHRVNRNGRDTYANRLLDYVQGVVPEQDQERIELHPTIEENYFPAGMTIEEYARHYAEQE